MHSVEPIAIIGIGCRLPGGVKCTDDLWRLLTDGVDAITEVPKDRWDHFAVAHPDASRPGRMSSCWGGFLDRIDRFDAQFFGINAREAAAADPQQRLLLEVAYEAVEDAGLTMAGLAGRRAGVYVGISTFDYPSMQFNSIERPFIDGYTNLGSAFCVTANRISYFFNLNGPSLAIDTACSSSLVATHLGCVSIWNGESDLAFVGGVNIILRPEPTIGFSKAAMLSPDGRCKSFDAAANGYVRSEGAVVVILKPLARAKADGDTIHALIRATAVNQDGRTEGISVPSRTAQEENQRAALRLAGIAPQSIQYVEAHGTGTPVGDPIEASAIGAVYGRTREPDERCVIGSVKSNVGHLEAASGVTGLLKAMLALKHRQIPATLHLDKPNPAIPFEDLGLRVAARLEPWPASNGQPARAGVNSFGFGGTNAHVILEEAPADPLVAPAAGPDDGAYLLPLSARAASALPDLARSYLRELPAENGLQHVSLRDICFSAATTRTHHPFRQAFIASNKEELAQQLESFIADEGRPAVVRAAADATEPVFICSGMGQQWWGMGRELLAEEPVFRRSVEKIGELFEPWTGWSLIEKLSADEHTSQIQDTDVAQPAIFAVQVALADLWRSWGIKPAAVLGHSAGEMAAACIAGALSREDAVAVTYHRSRLQRRTAGQGAMLAAGISREEAEILVEGYSRAISIAAINSPRSVTFSGDAAVLGEVAKKLESLGLFNRGLQVEVPFHSPKMEPLERELVDSLRSLRPRPATTMLFSTVTAARVAGPELDAEYWYRNVRRPVLFSDTVAEIIKAGHGVFLEVSAHPVLRNDLGESLSARSARGTVLGSLRHGEHDRQALLATLARLYELGCDVAWRRVFPQGRAIKLPTYPFQREVYWRESEYGRQLRIGEGVHPLLGNRLDDAKLCWKADLDRADLHYLSDHRIGGAIIFPGAGYLEIGLAVARETLGLDCCDLEDLEFQKFLVLDDKGGFTAQVTFDPECGDFQVNAKAAGSDSAWDLHSRGTIRHQGRSAPTVFDLDAIRKDCSEPIDRDDYFEKFSIMGFNYGPAFRGLTRLWRGGGAVLAEINAPADIAACMTNYRWHPALLDACLQITLASLPDHIWRTGEVFVPARIDRVRCYGPATSRVFAYSGPQDFRPAELKWNIHVFDETGKVLLVMEGLACYPTRYRTQAAKTTTYELEWVPAASSIRRSRRDASHLPSPNELALILEQESEALFQRFDRARYQDQLLALSRAASASYVARALTELGGIPADFAKSAETLIGELGVAPQYHRWMRLIRDTFTPDEIAAAKNPDKTWKRLWDEFPDNQSEVRLIQHCGENLAAILKGEIDPLTMIFPDGSFGNMENLYRDSPTYRIGNLLAQKMIAELVVRLPQGKSLRILEVGGGVGGLTSYILPVLPTHCTSYVFTDVSARFLPLAEASFSNHPFVEYRALDIERDPLEQGFERHSFDLIIASDVLHATRNLRHALATLKQLLGSEGSLLMFELTRAWPGTTMTFGLLKGWWLFDDSELRHDGPCVSQANWQSVLGEAGFGETIFLPDSPDPGRAQHGLILARGPHVVEQPALVPEQAADVKNWLVFVDGGAAVGPNAGAALAAQLRQRGNNVIEVAHGAEFSVGRSQFTVRAGSADDMKRLLATLASEMPRLAGVAHLWSLDAASPDAMTGHTLVNSTTLGCISVAQLIQALAVVETLSIDGLWLITRMAQYVEGAADTVEVSQSPLCGFGRVLGSEYRDLHFGLIDLGACSADEITALVEHLTSGEAVEDEIALRGELKFVRRLVRASQTSVCGLRRQRGEVTPPFRLEVRKPGILSSMAARRIARTTPNPNEVEIEVAAAGFNFVDLMLAMGLLPREATGGVSSEKMLGMECAGRIVRIGTDAVGLAVGDEVVAAGVPTFATHITVNQDFVVLKPANLTLEAAATLPIAFTTASYALRNLAQVRPGERILIHAATGGVGLAAVQIAQTAGAVIFATAGSPDKRALLTALGVPHVMDSRGLAFADEIMDITNGEGIDVVLNSLAGEAIDKSLAILRPYGRFVEIGKIDIYKGRKLGLRALRKNIAYFIVDFSRPFEPRPNLGRSVLDHDVTPLLATRKLRPLPYRVFPAERAADAFRLMAQAKHIGKLLVSFKDSAGVVVERATEPLVLDPSASYVITGGLGGFGLATAEYLVQRGARNLVLVGRSVPSPSAQSAVNALHHGGVSVVICQEDVADRIAVERALAAARKLGPLRGIMHAAMVLDDAPIERMSEERLWNAMAPKAFGAWHLHTATAEDSLDFFVLFSSISTIFGNRGQANYCAGNAFLESLAGYRRVHGLPALAVNWGVISDVGHVARNVEALSRLRGTGYVAMSAADMLTTLDELLASDTLQVAVAEVDWTTLLGVGIMRSSARYAKFADEVGADKGPAAVGSRVHDILAADAAALPSLLEDYIRDHLARAMGITAARIDTQQPLLNLGLDSLIAVEVRNQISNDFSINVPLSKFTQSASVSGLSAYVAERLLEGRGDTRAGADATTVAAPSAPEIPANGLDADLIGHIDQLSDVEVDHELDILVAKGAA